MRRSLLFVPALMAASAVATVTFIDPPPRPDNRDEDMAKNPRVKMGDAMDVKYDVSDYNKHYDLVLWKKYPASLGEDDPAFQRYTYDEPASNYTWRIDTKLFENIPKDEDSVFFWTVFIDGDSSPAATSDYFNITQNRVTTTASSMTSATSTTSSSTSSATMTPTQTPKHTSPHGLAAGAIAGIVVGVVVVVLTLFGVVGCFFWRKRHAEAVEKGEVASYEGETKPTNPPTYENFDGWKAELASGHNMTELQAEGVSPRTELANSEVQTPQMDYKHGYAVVDASGGVVHEAP